MRFNNPQNGFSLVELLVVVAIIGIIAAIATPNLLASRRAANEGSALSAMRSIHSAQVTYLHTAGDGKYGTLDDLKNEGLLDPTLGSGQKSGYKFDCPAGNLTSAPPPTYFATAVPASTSGVARTGNRSFTIAEDGIVRGDVTDSAAANHTAATNSAIWPPL